MSQEIYKRYRPKTLDRMVGCTETAHALKALLAKGKLPHTILFSGPSGCGKTTLARILKGELGCSDHDFAEMNSASYRGIDSVREIQRQINLAPVSGPCRIWLMDEVHKLSNDAQNAALKMLEDTPAHIYFFLATTEPNKLIKAIQTRCTEMPVRLLTEKELGELVARVCKKEGIQLSQEVSDELITVAQGSARSLLVGLEKIAALDEKEQLEAIKGRFWEENEAIELCRALIKKAPWKVVAGILKNLKGEAESVRYAVLGYARACLLGNGGWDAYNVICAFQNNFYDSKEAGLAAACYEALHAKE